MYTIQDVASGNTTAYDKVEHELRFILNDKMYEASSAIHSAITHLWLLPDTPEREALRERLYTISDEFEKILKNEYQNYTNTEK